MSELKDILITLVIVVGYFFLFGKKKKKPSPTPKRTPVMEQESPAMLDPEIAYQFSEGEETFLSQESNISSADFYPKNEKYFTYESIIDEEQNFNQNSGNFSDKKVEEESQIIDNEQESNSPIDISKEELIKGVIYSEILKRPYN